MYLNVQVSLKIALEKINSWINRAREDDIAQDVTRKFKI